MWDDAATRAAVSAIEKEIVANIRKRRDAKGNAYPPGRDLRETGQLLGSFRTESIGNRGAVVNTAPHAAPVNAKIEFMGLPPDSLAAIDRTVEVELRRIEDSLP